jgi:transcriptional regulator with XRE-family HTH domain
MKGDRDMKNPLKEKRRLMGVTREEIANKLNTKLYNINEWESGRVFPKSFFLIDIANAYEMTNDELIEYLKYLKIQKE